MDMLFNGYSQHASLTNSLTPIVVDNLGTGIIIYKIGRICILQLINAFNPTSISSDGFQLPYTPTDMALSICGYYDNANKLGYIRVNTDGKLYLYSDAYGSTISAKYLKGQLTFISNN